MTTDADIALEAAREKIQAAIEALTSVVVPRTVNGWDEYVGSRHADMQTALALLCEARAKLER